MNKYAKKKCVSRSIALREKAGEGWGVGLIWAGGRIDNNRLIWSTADLVVASYVNKNLTKITNFSNGIWLFYPMINPARDSGVFASRSRQILNENMFALGNWLQKAPRILFCCSGLVILVEIFIPVLTVGKI